MTGTNISQKQHKTNNLDNLPYIQYLIAQSKDSVSNIHSVNMSFEDQSVISLDWKFELVCMHSLLGI